MEDERLVAKAILESAQDPRATLYYRQFAEASQLTRTDTDDGFVAKPAWTTEDLVVELDDHATSAWVRCPDVVTGQPLEFRVNLRRAGFFGSLEGRAVQGRWPQDWHIDPSALRAAATGALRLPESRGEQLPAEAARLAGARRRAAYGRRDVPETGPQG